MLVLPWSLPYPSFPGILFWLPGDQPLPSPRIGCSSGPFWHAIGCLNAFHASARFLSQHLAASSGTGSSDFERLKQILEAIPQVKYVCLDVANGYSEHFIEFVKDVRKCFPKHTIMVCFCYPVVGTFLSSFHSSMSFHFVTSVHSSSAALWFS